MKYRIHEWVDTSDMSTVYGIQVQLKPRARWNHCMTDKGPIFYRDRERAMNQLRLFEAEDLYEQSEQEIEQ